MYNHRAKIRRDTFRCWQKYCNFQNLRRDNALRVSSKPGQIIAKFAYILLPQIKYDCFDISKSILETHQIYDPGKVDDR